MLKGTFIVPMAGNVSHQAGCVIVSRIVMMVAMKLTADMVGYNSLTLCMLCNYVCRAFSSNFGKRPLAKIREK